MCNNGVILNGVEGSRAITMKTIEQKAKKVPAIRFAGFDDEWVEKKIFDVAEIVGGGTPSTANPQFWDGNIDWYAPAEINDQVFVNGSERKITKLGLENSSAKVLPANRTVLFTSRAGIGKTAILQSPAATNQGFQSLVLNDDTDTYFVYSMTDKIKAKAERIASGSTFAEISGKMLGNLELVFPSKKEQSKIGSFFSNVDSLVLLEQKKYDKLMQVKKSMLEKMFPKEGATVPEIRFAGFKGDWEERKLSQLVSYFSSNLTAKDVQENGIYDLYDANGVIGKINCSPRKKEYISVIKDGAGVGRIRKLPKNTLVIGTMGILESIDSDLDFVFAMLERFELGKQFTGSTIPHIYFKDYGEHLYVVPDYCEQQKIGSYFSHLDSLISLQQRKLEKLKNIKKSLLEKMFV